MCVLRKRVSASTEKFLEMYLFRFHPDLLNLKLWDLCLNKLSLIHIQNFKANAPKHSLCLIFHEAELKWINFTKGTYPTIITLLIFANGQVIKKIFRDIDAMLCNNKICNDTCLKYGWFYLNFSW